MNNEMASNKKKRVRSPSYPSIDLEAALEKAADLYSHAHKHAAPVATILSRWGHSQKSSAGQLVLAAMKKFGLISYEGRGNQRHARLSELGLAIVQDKRQISVERDDAIKSAALSPTINSDLWNRYGGKDGVAPDETISYYLVAEKCFTESAAAQCIAQFKSTIAFARLSENDKIEESKGHQNNGGESSDSSPAKNQKFKMQIGSKSQESRELPLPLMSGGTALLTFPYPMSKEDFEWLKVMLDKLQKGILGPSEMEEPQEPPEE